MKTPGGPGTVVMTERTYVTTITSDFPLSYITRQPCAGFCLLVGMHLSVRGAIRRPSSEECLRKVHFRQNFGPTTDRTTEGRKSEQQSGGMLVSTPLAYFYPEGHESRLSRSVPSARVPSAPGLDLARRGGRLFAIGCSTLTAPTVTFRGQHGGGLSDTGEGFHKQSH